MDNKQAIEFIEQAFNVAVTKGAFNMVDVNNILIALSVIKGNHSLVQPENLFEQGT